MAATEQQQSRTTSIAQRNRSEHDSLEGVEKVYRTERIETVALTNINLTVREASSSR